MNNCTYDPTYEYATWCQAHVGPTWECDNTACVFHKDFNNRRKA